ncbi:MAG: methyltransferase domain-containing protein [Candidatus Eremiobacterota bacterium]
MAWDPSCYRRFQAHREAPFEDLFREIRVRPGMSVVDLGCGTGELTARLAERLPGSTVVGVDSSPEMLAQASARPGLSFREGRIEEEAGHYDLVFSHAAIHWVEHHERLIPALLERVRPGGQLAVQLPSNQDHPVHGGVLRVVRSEPFRSALAGFERRSPVLPLRRYAELLHACGAGDIVAFEKVYPHVLESSDAVVEWLRSTSLLPYLERLGELRDTFLDACRREAAAILPGNPVFFGFCRIHLVAGR